MLAHISWAKNHMLDPQEVYLQSADPKTEKVAHIYEEYRKELRKANALDFDDLLLEAVRLLKASAPVREYYNRRFQYILIDEYQDTNRPQYELMRLLAGARHNVCAVGDEDQSIYSWRGADIRNILEFENDFPEAKIVRLEQNYRSTQNILESASAVVANNVKRKGKNLWTSRQGGAKIGYYEAPDGENEALFVADWIARYLREAAGEDETPRAAVLYRTNSQSRLFEEAMRRYQLKYHVVGGFSFYERAEIKDLISYLKVIHNPDDSISLLRVINTPVARHRQDARSKRWSGLRWRQGSPCGERSARPSAASCCRAGAGRAEEFSRPDRRCPRRCWPEPTSSGWRESREGSRSLSIRRDRRRPAAIELDRSDCLRPRPTSLQTSSAGDPPAVEGASGPQVEPAKTLALQASPCPTASTADLLKFLIDRTGYIKQLEEEDTPEAYSRIENLRELVNAAMDSRDRGETLDQFLDHAALVSDADAYDERAQITLMTLHAAKGLEFPLVFLCGLEEGLFPHSRTFHHPDDIEEERRLCYVGMTRAMDTAGPDSRRLPPPLRHRHARSQRALRASWTRLPQCESWWTRGGRIAEGRAEPMWRRAPLRQLRASVRPSQGRSPESPHGPSLRLRRRRPDRQPGPRPVNRAKRSLGPKIQLHRQHRRVLRLAGKEIQPPQAAGRGSSKAEKGFRPGQKVRHPKYGEGTVYQREGEGEEAKITVQFPRFGLKKLVEKYAQLEGC